MKIFNIFRFFIVFLLIVPHGGISDVKSQAPQLSDRDDGTYVGLNWGAAGIAKTLSKLKPYVYDTIGDSLNNTILKALNYVWNSRYTLANGSQIPAWTKYEGLEIYPGQKYGAAGIINAFTFISDGSAGSPYVEYSLLAAKELMNQAQNSTTLPNWAYSYGYPPSIEPVRITDITFGSLGMIDAFLDLYAITQENWLMDSIELIYDWLVYTSRNRTIENDIFQIIPWYNIEGSTPEFRSSFSEGNAGAVEVFLRLYGVTGNQSYFDWAAEITKSLIASQLSEGGWPFFIDNPGVNNRISWKDGSVGILHSLLIAQNHKIGGIELNQSIDLGFQWLSDQFVIGENEVYLPEYVGESQGFTSHSRGLTGALQLYREYNSDTFNELYLEMIGELSNQILNMRNVNGKSMLLANVASIDTDYYDLSLSEGLAGIANELVQIIETKPNIAEEYNIQDLLVEIARSFIHLQENNGSWKRQILIENNSSRGDFSILPLIFSLIMVYSLKLKKRGS